MRSAPSWMVTRRDFLKASASTLAGLSISPVPAWKAVPKVRFGLITDTHYADADQRGTRYYRESVTKLTECVEEMKKQKVDFLLELGDFKDEDALRQEADTLRYLQEIEAALQQFGGPTYHALGNHDIDSISKAQFLQAVTNTGIPKDRSYYTFEVGGLHFVVLDANFRADGVAYDHGNFEWTDTNVPSDQLDWLAETLDAASGPALVFVHQRLDGEGNVFVNNAADVRQVMEASGKVLAAFHGHDHAGAHQEIEGIHYYTLKAVVDGTGAESNSYALLEVDDAYNITITGYRRAVSMALAEAAGGR